MDPGLIAQYVVVALAVAASAAFVVQSRWPQGVRRMRIACAVPLVRAARPAWVRRVGGWIAPAARGGGAGCDVGCDGCSSH
jgi:hypothetical protein